MGPGTKSQRQCPQNQLWRTTWSKRLSNSLRESPTSLGSHESNSSHKCCFTSTETTRPVWDGKPRTATSTFTQLLSSASALQGPSSMLLYVHRDRKDYSLDRDKQTDSGIMKLNKGSDRRTTKRVACMVSPGRPPLLLRSSWSLTNLIPYGPLSSTFLSLLSLTPQSFSHLSNLFRVGDPCAMFSFRLIIHNLTEHWKISGRPIQTNGNISIIHTHTHTTLPQTVTGGFCKAPSLRTMLITPHTLPPLNFKVFSAADEDRFTRQCHWGDEWRDSHRQSRFCVRVTGPTSGSLQVHSRDGQLCLHPSTQPSTSSLAAAAATSIRVEELACFISFPTATSLIYYGRRRAQNY